MTSADPPARAEVTARPDPPARPDLPAPADLTAHADLPARADLAQLRRQAKEWKRAALAGDPDALRRLRPYVPAGTPVTLALAQLAVAREHGFASWAALKAEVSARAAALAESVRDFLQRSLTGSAGAVRLLHSRPEIAGYDIRTAAVLGDAATVARLVAADPAAATRPDNGSGWPPLLYACMSRWHHLVLPNREADAEEMLRQMRERAAGLVATARLLLDAGADPDTTVDGRTPLYAAAGRANNAAITALLLERGARPDDRTVYLAAFHANPRRYAPGLRPGLRGPASHDCLRLLLRHHRLPATSTALAAPVMLDDVEGARLMLDAGADPNTPLPGELFGGGRTRTPLAAAIRLNCGPALVSLLRERGATAPSSPFDDFLDACARADRAAIAGFLRNDPSLPRRLAGEDLSPIVPAADRGDTEAVRLLLDAGFAADPALHAAARAGSAAVVRLLLAAGAAVDARDAVRGDTPLRWAVEGSGQRTGHDPAPDWVATVRTLLDAGADPAQAWAGTTFPSQEVARALVERGIDVPGKDVAMMRASLGLDPAG